MFFVQILLEETTLRTDKKNQSYLPHLQERLSFPFVFPKTCASFVRSSLHIRSAFAGSVSENTDRHVFPVYVLLSLGSTYDVFFASFCLRKTHLELAFACCIYKKECQSPSFFHRRVLLFQVRVCFYGMLFLGIAWDYIDRFLFLVFT